MLGHEPWRREREYLARITLVMGNRNQLQWDLPVVDSFEMNRAIFGIARPDFERARDELVELLEIGHLVTKPVRNLSLGERMKAEIAGALLHRPQVLFLDEPTIGSTSRCRSASATFLAEYNARYGATVMLTSHYMADVTALCRRVIVIHHGRLLYDGPLSELAERFETAKTVGVTLADPDTDLSRYGEVVAVDGARVTLRVPRAEASAVAARLLADVQPTDLTIEDPPIDDVIERVFATPEEPKARPWPTRSGAGERQPDATSPAPPPSARPPLARVGRPRQMLDFYATVVAHGRAGAVPVPRRQLHVHDRHGGRAGHLPRGVVGGRRGERRFGRRVHARRVRGVLHRVDARPEHEHRVHPVRLGVPHPRGTAVGDAASARSTRCTTTWPTSRAGR